MDSMEQVSGRDVYCKYCNSLLRLTQALEQAGTVSDIDLNLLRVFDALMDTGSVSSAAGRLHLSVPATSRALGRLRRSMNDPIMVRAGRGLVPTPFALRATARVRALLDAAEELLADDGDEDPATWRRTFVIRINDGLAPVLAPRLISRIARQAPDVSFRFVSQSSKDADSLRNGTIDLDIGVFVPDVPDLHFHNLIVDHFVALVAADSPLGRARTLSVDDLCRYPHISASRRGLDRGPIDDALAGMGRARRVIATVPTYAVATLLALEADVIALVPQVLARHLLDRGVPVRPHEVPLPLPELRIDMRWHRRLEADRETEWLRSHATAALQGLLPDQ
jgi:DNA-binding transcriptional LysR family regulator